MVASVMSLNDIMDAPIDSINAPHRPIPSGLISEGEAFFVASFFGVLAVLLSAPSLPSVILTGLLLLGGYSYSVRLKREGLVGNFLVSFLTASLIPYGASFAFEANELILVFFLMAFSLCVGRELIKGISDMKGDSLFGVNTVAVSLGPVVARNASVPFFVLAIALSFVPFAIAGFSYGYAFLIALADLLCAYSVATLEPSVIPSARKTANALYLSMLLGILAILFVP